MFTRWFYKNKYKKFINEYPILINKQNDYYQQIDYVNKLLDLHEHIPMRDISQRINPYLNISIYHDCIEVWLKDCTKYKSQILRQRVKNTDNLIIKGVKLNDFFTMMDERNVDIISGTNAIVKNIKFFYKEIMKTDKVNHYYYFGQLSDILITGIRIIEYQVHEYYQ